MPDLNAATLDHIAYSQLTPSDMVSASINVYSVSDVPDYVRQGIGVSVKH
jgi:hypothetical protein